MASLLRPCEAESRRIYWNDNVTREVRVSQWKDFLDEFSRAHQAWLAPVDSASRGVVQVQAVDRSATRGLEIVDDGGGCTLIRFRTATTATMLDGVAPGELS